MRVLLLAVFNEYMVATREEIGISFIAAYLRQKGIEVMITGRDENEIDFDKIVGFRPDVVGMPVYDVSKDGVYKIGKRIKELIPGVFLCIGGVLPTYFGETILREAPFIDCAIKGEGEYTMYELVSKLEKGHDISSIRGLIHRRGNDIIINEDPQPIEDINALPFPARDMLVDNKVQIGLMSTTRGCVGNCSFCTSQLFWKKWKGRDAELVVDELEHVVTNYGVRLFNFIDGSFEDPGINHPRVWEITRGIINRKLDIYYIAHFRADSQKKASPELMDLFRRSGLCGVNIGIESANAEDLSIYNKRASAEDNFEVVRLFRKYDIVPIPGFINFNPYSTFERLRQNIDYLEKFGFAARIALLCIKCNLYAGTKIYERTKNDNLVFINESGDIEYYFVDKRINTLWEYVNYYTQADSSAAFDFYIIGHYTFLFRTVLEYYKRLFERDKDETAINMVKAAQNAMWEKTFEFSSRACSWFRCLLDMAESNWDYKQADSLSNKYIDYNYVHNIAESLHAIKWNLYSDLARLNPAYESYIVDDTFNR